MAFIKTCSHLEQVNCFHLYSCKHITFCMRDKCYQCDKISPNTQPEGIGNNSVKWFLSGTFVHTWSRRMVFISTLVSSLHSVCRTCYQCDKVCPSTQPEWMANNSDGQLLLGLLFTLVAGECFSFILLYLSTLYSVCGNSPLYHFLCSNNSVNPSFPTGKGKYLLLCFLESKS